MEQRTIITLEERLANHPKVATTYEELSQYTGLAQPFLRKNKHRIEQLGITLTRKQHKRKEISTDPAVMLKSAVNSIQRHRGMFVSFLKFEHEIDYPTIEAAKQVLDSVSSATLPDDEMAIVENFKLLEELNYVIRGTTRFNDIILEEAKQLYSFDLAEEQINAISRMLAFVHQPRSLPGVVQAAAGTSKTTCINLTVKVLQRLGFEVQCLARTNKAKNALINGKTITKFNNEVLNINTVRMDVGDVRFRRMLQTFKGRTKKSDTVLIIDEYSFLSPDEILDFIDRFKHVILVGDIAQLGELDLPPAPIIADLNTQYRFLNATDKDVALNTTNNLRLGKVGAIEADVESRVAGTFGARLGLKRSGMGITPFFDYDGQLDHLKDQLDEFKGLHDIVVCYSKELAAVANKLLNGGVELKRGSKVIVNKAYIRQKEELVSKGTIGIIVDETEHTYILDTGLVLFDQPLNEEVPKSHCELGYALTTHVAQGSEWNKVAALLGTSNAGNRYSDTYVLLTRHTDKVTMFKRDDSLLNFDILHILPFLLMRLGQDGRKMTYEAAKYGLMLHAKNLGLSDEAMKRLSKELDALFTPPDRVERDQRYAIHMGSLDNVNLSPASFKFTRDIAMPELDEHSTIIENMQGKRYLTLDLDSHIAVGVFKDYLDRTEAWVRPDLSSAHLIFEVDDFYFTSHHKNVDIDILGNAKHTARFIKYGKPCNGLPPIPLPDEVLERLARLGITPNRLIVEEL